MTPRDTQRAKVYAAEEFVRTLFDRAAEHGNRVVEFFGTQLTLPPEGRFASAASVQRYVDDVLAQSSGALAAAAADGARLAAGPPPPTTSVTTTARPSRCRTGASTWALRELVVLHEIAHHLSDAEPPHGPEFVATFCELAEAVMGPEVAHVLRVVYAKEGVR